MAKILNLKRHLLSLYCSGGDKGYSCSRRPFLSSWFHSRLCTMLPLWCWVWHKFYSFDFSLYKIKFITDFPGVSTFKLLALMLCWGRKTLYSLERTGECLHAAWIRTVLTSLHIHGLTWQPIKDVDTFTHLEMYSCTSLRPSSSSLWKPLLLRKPSQTAEEIHTAA